MAVWFISDLHLEPSQTAITAGFHQFLKQPQPGDDLYILGDFFNYWIGDDYSDPYVTDIKQAVKNTADRGIRCFFMHGNRDFLIGEQFCQEAGCTLLDETEVITLNGEQVLLMHGDSLCTNDEKYMKFRAMSRSAPWQQMILSQSIENRIAFAEKARLESEANYKENGANETIMDVTPEEVVKALEEHQCVKMIHGHTHRPMIHDLTVNHQPAQRIVLGDWFKQGWYLKVDDDGFQLTAFDLN